jgi:hypothetical protein
MARPAQAGIDACGDIHVEASAMCAAEVEGGCEAHCEPVRFEAACAAKLEIECSGMCNAEAEASCTASCDVSACTAECDANPGSFECEAECSANADAHCAGECSASANRGQCEASCKASISAECEGTCQATPPTASCEAKCEARCEGECRGRANVDCQVSCQDSEAYAECSAELEGGCVAECESPEGALFCDGQYVDHGGNAAECIESLEDAITARVDVSARGSASGECSNGKCEAEAEGEAGCSARMAPSVPRGGAAAILAGFGLALALGARRRRSA